VSSYSHEYPDRMVALVLAGQVTLQQHFGGIKGKEYSVKAGDLIEIPEGSSVSWRVESPLMMHYNYGF
jgi:uncharacterized cupin superfamily protein